MATDRKSSNKGSCLQPSKFNTVTFSPFQLSFLNLTSINCAKGEEQQLLFSKKIKLWNIFDWGETQVMWDDENLQYFNLNET